MGLAPEENAVLKTVMSRRICLEQALITEVIPASYLRQVIDCFPEAVRSLDTVADYYRAS